ncbi:MAG: FAD-binding protein [Acidobacteria bacterium]|nr:FAD-binding protein [Acidobacteriota bacterium]
MKFISSELLRNRAELFRHEAQKARFRIFVSNHKSRNTASKADDLVESILRIPPIPYFRNAAAGDLILRSQELSQAIIDAHQFYVDHGSDDPGRVALVNAASGEVARLLEGFSLSDIDERDRAAREATRRDVANFYRRMTGEVDHEAKWIKEDGQWTNWNRDIRVFPKEYKGDEALTLQTLRNTVEAATAVRIVAGGHAFNTSPDTGGTAAQGVGVLITLDNLKPPSGQVVESVTQADAQSNYGLADGSHVFRVSAGLRLREFTKLAWAQGVALPVAGSTDAQSIGGLIATDLHSTGRSNGFLSERLVEVTVLDHQGRPHRFRRNDQIARGAVGRWVWERPDNSVEQLRRLPVSGALGMTGVAVEAVLQLDPAFAFQKDEQYVPRSWFNQNVARLLDPNETALGFDYDHVSLYLAGGVDPAKIRTVRMNTWKHTTDLPPADALQVQRQRELVDHVGSAFLPNTILGHCQLRAAVPRSGDQSHSTLESLNSRDHQVLQANHAFARKLYFQHDEIELGIPLADTPDGAPDYRRYKAAVKATLELLQREEFPSIIEVRFTPNVSEGMIGPGARSRTCYIELATSMALYSRERITQVYHRFDRMLRDDFGARPHLGKKTSVDAQALSVLFPEDWNIFNDVRNAIDPNGKFKPANNELLNRLFS